MNKNSQVSTQTPAPHRLPTDPEMGGSAPELKKGNWLTRTWRTLKNVPARLSEYFKGTGSSEPTNIEQRDVYLIHDQPRRTAHTSRKPLTESKRAKRRRNKLDRQARVQQLQTKQPLEFAQKRLQAQRPLPKHYSETTLILGLSRNWQEITQVKLSVARSLIQRLVNHLPLVLCIDLLQKFNSVLKSNPDSTLIKKLNTTLKSHQDYIKKCQLPRHTQQSHMQTLAEYLLKNAEHLPKLSTKGLAACAEFSRHLETASVPEDARPQVMEEFINYFQKNTAVFTSLDAYGIVARFVFEGGMDACQSNNDKLANPILSPPNTSES